MDRCGFQRSRSELSSRNLIFDPYSLQYNNCTDPEEEGKAKQVFAPNEPAFEPEKLGGWLPSLPGPPRRNISLRFTPEWSRLLLLNYL